MILLVILYLYDFIEFLLEVRQFLSQLHRLNFYTIQFLVPVDTNQYLIFGEIVDPLVEKALQINSHWRVIMPFIHAVGLGGRFA